MAQDIAGANYGVAVERAPAVADSGVDAGGIDSGTAQIAGLSVLKGLILYAATFTFAALYIYFIIKISGAKTGSQPTLDGTLVGAASALAGVLGAAFALEIGTPTGEDDINSDLGKDISAPNDKVQASLRLRRLLSLEPPDTKSASWPKTFGIWVYAFVGSAVAITYVLNQNETPGAIKALAVAFGGYVITLVTTAYGIKTKSSS